MNPYIVCTVKGFDELYDVESKFKKAVNNCIDKGYEPLGGVSLTPIPYISRGSTTNQILYIYSQAMILRGEKDESRN